MRSIIDACQPRQDILAGTFNPEIFTASLGQVLAYHRHEQGIADSPYTDPQTFFGQATYPTEGMRMVVTEVFSRIDGNNTAPAIHRLETAFGGGKTHTLIALTHLAFEGASLTALVQPLFGEVPLPVPGAVAVVGIAGDELPVHKPQGTALLPYTLWGEMAYQIGGAALYREVAQDAASFAAPGKRFLEKLFAGRQALVLLDELAQYAARLDAAQPNGADQLAAFLMALHGYARSHAGIAIVVTLASQTDAFARQSRRLAELLSKATGKAVDEPTAVAVADRAESGIRSVVARDASTVVPVQAAEISKVLAKRLFDRIDREAAGETADHYVAMYRKSSSLLPEEATRPDYRETLVALYPFHPSFVAFLNQKLATVETFQGTRGVLRVLALAIRTLWQKQVPAPMLHACHLDMRDARTVNEIIGRTGAADLLAVLNTDIGGPDTGALAGSRSRAELADQKNPHPAGFPLHEYTWKTVFLHSLVGRAQGLGSNLFGITLADAVLAVAFPGMSPAQVETALQAIDKMAFYLRRNEGRYYASLDPSVNRALASIREGLHPDQIAERLAATARQVITKDQNTFAVAHDVFAPEHVPDSQQRPVVGVVALDTERFDPEGCVTTVGPNRPRCYQNHVFLLVPETTQLQGDTWNEARVLHARELRNRLEDLARTVIAMRTLAERPQDYGIASHQLVATHGFDLKERDKALETAVSQLYNTICFSSASGQVISKSIRTAGGEGGISVVAEIRQALRKEGELIDAETAATQETVIALGKLFFELNPTPSLQQIRENFAVNRRWPVLDEPDLLEQIVRAGVNRGIWCLFRMGGAERVRPEQFYSREQGDLPFDLDLKEPGWALVTPEGARQRGWGVRAEVDEAKVERWLTDAVAEESAMVVYQLGEKLVDKHGEMPEQAILKAVDRLVQRNRAMTYTGKVDQQEKPANLVHGPAAIMHATKNTDVLITPAEAAQRGWVREEDIAFTLRGADAVKRILPLLGKLGSLYSRGAKSKVDALDLADLEVGGGGRLRLVLENMTPAGMKNLAELFESLAIVAKAGSHSEAEIEIKSPVDGCVLMETLRSAR